MDAARIAALLHPFLATTLPEASLRQVSTYIDLLLRWNARINLTAVRDPEQIVIRHFGESFFLARHVLPPETSVARTFLSAPAGAAPRVHVLDLGSGAGFPALPLKIWYPTIHLTLIESNHKKAAFLREVARSLTLMDIDVIAERAETLLARLGPDLPHAGVVTLRAVERFDTVLPLAVKFLAPAAARLALLIGSCQLPTLPNLAPTIDWLPPIRVPKSRTRILAIGVPGL